MKPRLRRLTDGLLVTLIVAAVLGLALGAEWLRAKFYGWVIAGEIEQHQGGGALSAREHLLRQVADMKAQCSCPFCAGRSASVGFAHVASGAGPASISAFDFLLPTGPVRLVSVVIDDGMLREVVLPAILQWMDKREQAAAAAEAENEARAANLHREGGA